MLLECVRRNERFEILVPRRGVYQYIKADKIAQHKLNALLKRKGLLHCVYHISFGSCFVKSKLCSSFMNSLSRFSPKCITEHISSSP